MIYFNSLRKPIPWALVVKKNQTNYPIAWPTKSCCEV